MNSLGAAAAVIAARDFYHQSGGKQATVYTFGQVLYSRVENST